jgi:hypothetical protein
MISQDRLSEMILWRAFTSVVYNDVIERLRACLKHDAPNWGFFVEQTGRGQPENPGLEIVTLLTSYYRIGHLAP